MSNQLEPTEVRAHRHASALRFLFWFFAVGVIATALLWPRSDRFEVSGVPFRIWIAQHPYFQIQDPLAAVGTNATPHLIRILRESADSPRAVQVRTWIWKHLPQRLQSRFQRWYAVPQWQLKRTALFGLRFLGPEA